MLRLNAILGHASDPEIAEKLHRLQHEGRVEYLALAPSDTLRKRLRVTTDKDTDCAVALARSERLENGSVLMLTDERAIVVQLEEQPWLELEAADMAAALELGFMAGHFHWRVKFAGSRLRVAVEGPEDDYRDRLVRYLETGRVRIVENA